MGMFFRKQKTVGNDNQAPLTPPTLIGSDSRLDGMIETEGEIHIDGIVRGVVKAGTCIVGKDGEVEGEIVADDIVVHGRVIGPLRGNHVHLQAGASVDGDITCDTIAIDNGARLSGAVWQGSEEAEARHAPASGPRRDGSSSLFGETLWSNRPDDDFRPLKAIRPRNSA
jgi:cytoskeletal protein CcmA (bactofilin family)